jgi:hypothetical protein
MSSRVATSFRNLLAVLIATAMFSLSVCPVGGESYEARIEPPNTIKWVLLSVALLTFALFYVSYELFIKRVMPALDLEAKKFVERSRAMGKGDDTIRETLKNSKWPEKKIDRLLKH